MTTIACPSRELGLPSVEVEIRDGSDRFAVLGTSPTARLSSAGRPPRRGHVALGRAGGHG